jgi:chorismate mutase
MAIFSKNADDIQGDVEAQIAALRKEISKISASLSDLSGERFEEMKRVASRQARHAADTAKENPIATLAIVAGAALLIGLFSRR